MPPLTSPGPANSGSGPKLTTQQKKVAAQVGKKATQVITGAANAASNVADTSPLVNEANPLPAQAAAGGHSVVLVLATELLAVGFFTLIAGISDEAGKAMVLFMGGLWLIYMITTSAAIGKLGTFVSNAANQSAGL
jgi:hypothetical protein